MLFSISCSRPSRAAASLLVTSDVHPLSSSLSQCPCGFDQPPIGPAPIGCSSASQFVADHDSQYQYTLHDSQTTPGTCSRCKTLRRSAAWRTAGGILIIILRSGRLLSVATKW
jgi:hypothetical protein